VRHLLAHRTTTTIKTDVLESQVPTHRFGWRCICLEFQGRERASDPGEERSDPEHSKQIGILGACALLSLLDLVQCQ